MKIIDNRRDYYDYCVSVFGYDEHIVYDRRESYKQSEAYYKTTNEDWDVVFAICGEYVPVVKRGKIITANPEHEIFKQTTSSRSLYQTRGGAMHTTSEHAAFNYLHKTCNINDEYNTPILLVCGGVYKPILANYGLASIIPPQEMYQRIYTWLSYKKDNPNPADLFKMTDKQKVQSHGFDVKTSFRPKIKEKA